MVQKIRRNWFWVASLLLLQGFIWSNCGCSMRYSFRDGALPDDLKTIKINNFDNRATYVNPQFAPTLSDRLRQKFTQQTRLTQTNSDDADWIIGGKITQYTFGTSGISQQNVTMNKWTVNVDVSLRNNLKKTDTSFTVMRNIEFSANTSTQVAENNNRDDMIKNLLEDIFTRLLSDW